MRQIRLNLLLLVLCVTVAACGGDKSPTAPTPPPTPTRIIALEGNLAFGNIDIGSSFTATLRIRNNGTETLNVTGMNSPGAGSVFFADWNQGNIAPGSSQAVTIRFSPTAAQSYGGTLTVNGNQTSGTNTIPISGTGACPARAAFRRTGFGNTVFDMPLCVNRLLIRGRWNGQGTSNFIVHVDGRSVVNEILRQTITYEGVHQVNGGKTVEIVSSGAIDWSFEEIQ